MIGMGRNALLKRLNPRSATLNQVVALWHADLPYITLSKGEGDPEDKSGLTYFQLATGSPRQLACRPALGVVPYHRLDPLGVGEHDEEKDEVLRPAAGAGWIGGTRDVGRLAGRWVGARLAWRM